MGASTKSAIFFLGAVYKECPNDKNIQSALTLVQKTLSVLQETEVPLGVKLFPKNIYTTAKSQS